MKEIMLTTWERVQLAFAVGSHIPGRGTVAAVRLGCKALDVLELTEEEKVAAGYTVLPDGSLRWRRDAPEWGLEFQDDVWKFVSERAESFQDWPVSRLTAALLDKVLDGRET